MQSESKFLQMPRKLKIANGLFLFFWIVIAVFPIFWVAIMSFKDPVDAFAHNFFQVIFGYETLKSGSGISIIEIVIWMFAVYLAYKLSLITTKVFISKIEPILGTFLSWIVYSVFYVLALVLFFGFVVVNVSGFIDFLISHIPIVEYLSYDILGFTLDNYKAVWVENEFYDNFINSLIITFGVVCISLTIGTLAGYALARRGSNLAFWLLMIALIFRALPHSVLVTGYVPAFINSKEFLQPLWEFWATGWFFSLFGDEAPTVYGHPIPVIIVLVSINQPFTIWMLRSFFMNIPTELDEAARVDGCSTFKAFRMVIVPIMWPGIITTGLFSFLLAYNDYLLTSLVFVLGSQTMFPAISQYFNRETTATDQINAVSAAVSIIIPLFFLVIFFQKQIVSGLTQGAVK